MNRVIENDQRFEKIDLVTTIACDVLKNIDGTKRITAMYFFEQLKDAISDCEAYSYVDIGIIVSIIFDTFDECCSRMSDDEFEYNY